MKYAENHKEYLDEYVKYFLLDVYAFQVQNIDSIVEDEIKRGSNMKHSFWLQMQYLRDNGKFSSALSYKYNPDNYFITVYYTADFSEHLGEIFVELVTIDDNKYKVWARDKKLTELI